MRRFTKLVSSLPLGGKMLIRRQVLMVFISRTSAERRSHLLALLITLALFFAGHGMQIWMGYTLLVTDPPFLMSLVALPYMAVNAAAILTHLILLVRAVGCLNRGRYPRGIRFFQEIPARKASEAVLMTLIGQLTFFACYVAFT